MFLACPAAILPLLQNSRSATLPPCGVLYWGWTWATVPPVWPNRGSEFCSKARVLPPGGCFLMRVLLGLTFALVFFLAACTSAQPATPSRALPSTDTPVSAMTPTITLTATPEPPTPTAVRPTATNAPPTVTVVRPTATLAQPQRPWVPISGGNCPAEYPVKANPDSMIYHVPGGASYSRTTNARVQCFVSRTAAETAGYRAALR